MRLAGDMVRVGQQKNERYIIEIQTNKIQYLGRSSVLSTIISHMFRPLLGHHQEALNNYKKKWVGLLLLAAPNSGANI